MVNSVASQQQVPYRPLGLIKNVTEILGFPISHSYEELIFFEHNAFLLRMEEEGENVSLIFNNESEIDKRAGISEAFRLEGIKHDLTISEQGTYAITPNEADGTLDIEFLQI